MSAESPRIQGRWQRSSIYRGIVIAYLLAMSSAAGYFLVVILWHHFHPDPSVIESIGPPLVYYVLPPVVLMATSALAVFMLLTKMEGLLVGAVCYSVLLLWTLVTLFMVFSGLAIYSEAELRQIPQITYWPQFVLVAAASVSNGLMYVLLRKL